PKRSRAFEVDLLEACVGDGLPARTRVLAGGRRDPRIGRRAVGAGAEHEVTGLSLHLVMRVLAKWSALRRIRSGRADLAAERVAILIFVFVGRAGGAEFVRIDVAIFVV